MSAAKKAPAPRKAAAKKSLSAEFDMDAADLLRGLHNARLFCGRDPYLPILLAVCIEGTDEGLSFAATDRYTIGCTTVPIKVPDFQFILCGDDAALLARLFTAKSGALTVAVTDDTFTVQPAEGIITAPQVVVTCRREPGEFPKWRPILDGTGTVKRDPYEAGAPVGMNGRYLARFARVKSDQPPAFSPLRLRVTATDGPMYVDIGEQFRGAQMPVRLDAAEYARVTPKESAA